MEDLNLSLHLAVWLQTKWRSFWCLSFLSEKRDNNIYWARFLCPLGMVFIHPSLASSVLWEDDLWNISVTLPCPLVSGSVWTMVVSTPGCQIPWEKVCGWRFWSKHRYHSMLMTTENSACGWGSRFCGCSSAWSVGFCINGHEAEKRWLFMDSTT